MNVMARNLLISLGKGPYLKSAAQAGSLMVTGDIISQTYLEKKNLMEIDVVRSLRFGAIGFFFVGPSLGYWYGFLERRVLFKSAGTRALGKMACDQLLFAPIFLCGFIAVNSASSGKTQKEVVSAVKRDYTSILVNNYKVWPAVQLLNFWVVPLNFRVLFVQTVAIAWNTYLSWVTNRKDK